MRGWRRGDDVAGLITLDRLAGSDRNLRVVAEHALDHAHRIGHFDQPVLQHLEVEVVVVLQLEDAGDVG